MTCTICGRGPSPYPNWLHFKGGREAAHIGCLADDYLTMRARVVRLYDVGIVSGAFGPWADAWTDDDRAMWEKLDDLKRKAEVGS